jgi:hypothetical protein
MKAFPKEEILAEIVREDASRDARSHLIGRYLVAQFIPQGVTLDYEDYYEPNSDVANVTIRLFGKQESIGEVEKIVLAEIAFARRTHK